MANTASLRKTAFSSIVQLSIYPSVEENDSLNNLFLNTLPYLAKALNNVALQHYCTMFMNNFELHAHEARVEFTRALYTEHTLHPSGARYLGSLEEPKLARILKSLGLKPALPSDTNADHISCQAELLSYCSHMESEAWKSMDAVSAMEWKELGESIYEEHSREFFTLVSHDILAASTCLYFRIWGNTIESTVTSDPFASSL